jgi:pimeloyl-ACP methyl ester carboxylesterase
MFTQMCLPTSDPHLRERVLKRLSYLDPAFGKAIVLNAVRWEAQISELLTHVNIPALLVQSTYLDEGLQLRPMQLDMTTPWTRLWRERIPRSVLQVVPDVGHFAQLEAPGTVTDLIRGFVQVLPGVNSS